MAGWKVSAKLTPTYRILSLNSLPAYFCRPSDLLVYPEIYETVNWSYCKCRFNPYSLLAQLCGRYVDHRVIVNIWVKRIPVNISDCGWFRRAQFVVTFQWAVLKEIGRIVMVGLLDTVDCSYLSRRICKMFTFYRWYENRLANASPKLIDKHKLVLDVLETCHGFFLAQNIY